MNKFIESEIQEMNHVMQEEVTGFKVDSLESANWCFRKIRALKEQIAENKALADAEKFRIDEWEKKENESAKNSIEYFEVLLQNYYVEQKQQDKKFKLSTPYGKVSARKSTKWNYRDEVETLNYLNSNGYNNLIKIKQELNKAELKKAFKDGVNAETGEILPGVDVEEVETVSIKVE
ncbi:host-nuclease inhibitor Gam family protein [Clostridium haemolyticum]|uniref:Phage protein n=1 Tax=Clostridium haemolyticum NCTC 9693 TaxID=1443114 RepID=A0ABR4TGY4_CLOHA|nr:hypothetical protein Z960_04005 [Clostridium haemolyticum NCTC 9693]KGN04208.1 hypothetical protein Z961_04475 [Clostridium haemolyticum NCTC 8350]